MEIMDLKKRGDAESVLAIISDDSGKMSAVNFATCWTSLATMNNHSKIKADPRFEAFKVETALRLAGDPRSLTATFCANVIHSCAKMRLAYMTECRDIVNGIIEENLTKRIVETGTSQNVANVAWSLVQLGVEANNFFKAVEARGEEIVSEGSPLNVANIAWALARQRNVATLESAPTFFEAVDRKGTWLVSEGSAQNVSNTIWAMAKLGHDCPRYCIALDRRAYALVLEGEPQSSANIVWALAKLRDPGRKYFMSVDLQGEVLAKKWDALTIGIVLKSLSDANFEAPVLLAAVDERGNARTVSDVIQCFDKFQFEGTTLKRAWEMEMLGKGKGKVRRRGGPTYGPQKQAEVVKNHESTIRDLMDLL
jgi:hypothetical protein